MTSHQGPSINDISNFFKLFLTPPPPCRQFFSTIRRHFLPILSPPDVVYGRPLSTHGYNHQRNLVQNVPQDRDKHSGLYGSHMNTGQQDRNIIPQQQIDLSICFDAKATDCVFFHINCCKHQHLIETNIRQQTNLKTKQKTIFKLNTTLNMYS